MKPIKAILIGAGQRGADAYASYALKFPNEINFVGVAEPRKDRLDSFIKDHNISKENAFTSYTSLLEKDKFADCVLVCTQDQMHFEPVILALKKGYNVLCEKPMSVDKDEILKMEKVAKETGNILSIAHVLRYSPFFKKIKELIDSNAVGQIVNIQHKESIGYWHMAHSFVRGNWRKEEESSPIIMAKSCHDLDILSYLVGSRCKRISSYGSLSFFKEENAPKGASKRCLDNCIHAHNCPYYAPEFYLNHPKAKIDNFLHVVSHDTSPQAVLKELETGAYGRCVFYCDNDVCDHQVVNLEYENGVTASFTMSAFSKYCEREINIMGTHGEIKGNMRTNEITYYDFISKNEVTYHISTTEEGHGGSDYSMICDFVQLLNGNSEKNKTDVSISVESHLLAIYAELSRKCGGKSICIKD